MCAPEAFVMRSIAPQGDSLERESSPSDHFVLITVSKVIQLDADAVLGARCAEHEIRISELT